MKLYGTGRHMSHVHASPACPRLLRTVRYPILELDESYFKVKDLCGGCFSGQVQSIHVRCRTCGHSTTRPCPHNGGVRIRGRTRTLWVWPEDSLRPTLVNPVRVE